MSRENQLKPDLLSIANLNPWTQHDSSSRMTMFTSSHIGQTLVVADSDIRRCQTGSEREYGKFTFSVKFPCDANVIKVIPKYRQSIGKGSINENPSVLIIYEDIATKRVGMLEVLNNSLASDNKHQHFGFKYKHKDILSKLHEGMHVPKGTIISDSPNIDDDGNYKYGVEANVAFMSVPGIIEDGVVVSKSFLERIKTKGFEKRNASWGNKYYPLNLYGDADNYKPFPEIGDRIRDDGLLFALRSYDDLLAPVEMDASSLDQPDYIFDKLVYGVPGAKVVDINIQHNTAINNPPTPLGMDTQARKYYESEMIYHKAIIDVYENLYRLRSDSLDITPELQRQIVESMAYVGVDNIPAIKRLSGKARILKRKIDKKYRRADIDDWDVTVTFEYDAIPDDGFKLTDCHGGKGVICDIWDDSEMPVDEDGNRAEIIMDGDSTIKRMNIGRVYEQYLNACSRDISKQVRVLVKENPEQGYTAAWELVSKYYSIVSPRMLDLLESKAYHKGIKHHIDSIVEDGIYLWLPTDNPVESIEMIKRLRDEFEICFGPVKYAGGFVTDRPVLIGSLYILLLEKTGSDWAAVGSSKLQHFGIPAKVTNADKHASPGRNQPVRILGEAEVRLMNAYVGSDVVVDLLDQSNSPQTHKTIVNNILTSEAPTSLLEIIDRNEVPLGNSRSLMFVKHVLECGGIQFVREIDDPLRAADMEKQIKEQCKK